MAVVGQKTDQVAEDDFSLCASFFFFFYGPLLLKIFIILTSHIDLTAAPMVKRDIQKAF